MPSAQEIASAVWNWDGIDPLHPTKANPKHQPENVLTEMLQYLDRTERKVEAGNAAITEMAKALAARDSAVDVDSLVARIKAEIERVTVRLDVPDSNDAA